MNTRGQLFRLTTFGESHGAAIGGVIDGIPANITLDFDWIRSRMQRRKPGQSKIVSQRKEEDEFEILSGLFEGKTTGTPLAFIIPNTNKKTEDYDHLKDVYRPSHADYTYDAKYGHRDHRGGGRSSARETANWVFAGAIAQQLLREKGIDIRAYVNQVGTIAMEQLDSLPTEKQVNQNEVRCPNPEQAKKMIDLIRQTRKAGDTIGGQVHCAIHNVPASIGAPIFNKLQADLAQAMMTINAVKGFSYGSGFDAVHKKGSEHNDQFSKEDFSTTSNDSGGVQGGISNGAPIYFDVAFKPVATLMQAQTTKNKAGENVDLAGKGRHDPCVVPRAVPIVEAMAALVLLDQMMLNQASTK